MAKKPGGTLFTLSLIFMYNKPCQRGEKRWIIYANPSDLKYYDKVSRMVRTKNRKAYIITVKRFKCPVCNCIHRNLPNNIFPYKQYDARIITGVIEGKITSDMIDYEDYPCEMTMTRWRTLNLQSLLWENLE